MEKDTAKVKAAKPKAVADPTHDADSTGAVAKDAPKGKAAKPKVPAKQAHDVPARGPWAFFALCFVAGLAAYWFVGPDIPRFFASTRDDGDASAVPSSIDKADFVINPRYACMLQITAVDCARHLAAPSFRGEKPAHLCKFVIIGVHTFS